ncbi:RNA deprotection pyrophosphohydrolase [Tenuibacillus multivorans]|uniref:8-oxo-dGTP diphosphatase n=1 Tax=Tenuibacillus multivorans TaxID=237069 RepID=A0A1H0FQA7_9BACI|nr:nucleoside triphosphatase YtkD [Tenuibacillus multivorans]GEL77931.1 nucleoside triphosphatase YtkD [Tenuibacillus multivorans]SDN96722.1 8-oxo-dGTP diphosphatase [Tenuibacillus multivorans]
MKVFKDYYHNTVKLVLGKEAFSKQPKHVWVITRYQGQWLLTKHADRGTEFPGGKVEHGEDAQEAAIREVKEETGGHVSRLNFIGQYYVDGKAGHIIKNIYFANVDEIEDQEHYFETEGPVLLNDIPRNIKKDDRFSFMMKDEVLVHALKVVREKYINKEA